MKKTISPLHSYLHKYLMEYLPSHRRMSSQTIKTYRQSLNDFRTYILTTQNKSFERLTFDDFSRSMIYSYLVDLKENRKLSISTINLRLSAIKSFLKFCGEESIEFSHYYQEVLTIHAYQNHREVQVKYLKDDQLARLFNAPDNSLRLGRRDQFILVLAYETGMRVQELLSLRVQDFLRNDRQHITSVRIHGKGNKVRYIPIMPHLVGHIDAYLKEFHPNYQGHEFLIYTIHQHIPTQMTTGTLDYLIKKYGKLVHSEDSHFPKSIHMHMLRHSIAMTMYKNGIPISYIRDFLGHSSLETTSIYAYSTVEDLRSVLESIDQGSEIIEQQAQKQWQKEIDDLLIYCGLV